MEPVNIRLYYGGHFVSKNKKTDYVRDPNLLVNHDNIALKLNVEEVCFFEFVHWIKKDLGFEDVGEIWFRKKGCSLHNGRVQFRDDNDIPEFLQAPEPDGFYNLYVVHPHKVVTGDGLSGFRHASWVGPYNEKERFGLDSSEVNESVESGVEFIEGGDFGKINSGVYIDSTSGSKECLTTKQGGPPKQLQPNNPNHTSICCSKETNQPPKTAALNKETPKKASFRPKLPTISKHKKPIVTPVVDKEARAEEETDAAESDDDESDAHEIDEEYSKGDVDLSEDDIEDQADDELFNKYVDGDIKDTVRNSFRDFNVDVSEEADLEVNEEGPNIPEDADLNDSDGEDVSDVGTDGERDQYPVFNPDTDFKGKISLSKGLKFTNNNVCRKALQWHAIENSYNYYFLHNNNTRVSAYCANRCKCPWRDGRILECTCGSTSKCRWKIHCTKLKNEKSWQIKSLRPKHICEHQLINPKCSSQYLAERFLEDFRDNPSWCLKHFIKRVRRECGVDIGYYKAYYARVRALKMIFGDAALEYEKVWDYAATIIKYNPGSTVIVKVETQEGEQPLFQRLYVCFKACKEGFMSGCRPILGVDGAHLKGPYPGILLTAVGKDGNNNLFPVAWAVVETENSETWSWFLDLLRADIASVADSVTWVHEADDLTYMSDRQKGLLDAFNKVMPNAETRYCCRHIWTNFKQKYPGLVYKQHFWKAARSTTKEHFNENIKKINEEAFQYLQAIPVEHWSRHGFSFASKSTMLLNNCCESFNSALREARSMPILQLMEWIRKYVITRSIAKREGLRSYNGIIMPSVVQLINKGLHQSTSMRLIQVELQEFEVEHEDYTYVEP